MYICPWQVPFSSATSCFGHDYLPVLLCNSICHILTNTLSNVRPLTFSFIPNLHFQSNEFWCRRGSYWTILRLPYWGPASLSFGSLAFASLSHSPLKGLSWFNCWKSSSLTWLGCELRQEKGVGGSREEATSEMMKVFQLGVIILWRLSTALSVNVSGLWYVQFTV